MSDNELLELYLKGDESAISETKKKYHNYLHKICYQILGVNEDIDECLNDTYFAAWKSIPSDKPTDIHSYLRKIARQKSIDILRKRIAGKRVDSEYCLSIDEVPSYETDYVIVNDNVERATKNVFWQENKVIYMFGISYPKSREKEADKLIREWMNSF